MNDESTVLDEAPKTASLLGLMSESIAAQLRADLKPKRTWARNKAWFEARIASLERHAEGLAERHAAEFRRAEFYERAAVTGWACVVGLLVLLAAKW